MLFSRFTYKAGVKVTQTFSYEAGFLGTGGKGSTSIQTSFDFSTEKTSKKTIEFAIELPVKVEPHSAVEAIVLIEKGHVSIPYTATFVRSFPNGAEDEATSTGVFETENGFKVLTKITDVKSGEVLRTSDVDPKTKKESNVQVTAQSFHGDGGDRGEAPDPGDDAGAGGEGEGEVPDTGDGAGGEGEEGEAGG